MPRRARPSDNVLFRLREWFGLRQDQLALYAGVSKATIQGVESGRRSAPAELLQALRPLRAHLPAPASADPPAALATAPIPVAAPLPVGALPELPELPGTPWPDADELDFRRRTCLYQAAGLRMQAEKIGQQAQVAERWARALPALLEAYPAPTAEEVAADDDAQRHHTWLIGWLNYRARPLPAEDVTRWHLLQARIAALEAEAALLAATLASQPTTP